MKKLILLSLTLLLAININAQSPESFKYQAVVRDGSGNVLASQNVGLQIKILKGSASGTAVYTETFTPTSNAFGLINLEIGTGTTLDDFSTIDWANDSYFIETSLDPTGGTSYSITGVSQLLSVPYALQAKRAQWRNNTNGIAYDGGNVSIGSPISGTLSRLNVVIDTTSSSYNTIRVTNLNSDGLSRINFTNDVVNELVAGVAGSTRTTGANEAFLWYFGNFDLKFATNNTERLRITAGGNVGIGTPAASVADPNPVKSKVHVAGGDVYIENIGSGVIMKSPDGNCWRMTVSNAGAPIFTTITCP